MYEDSAVINVRNHDDHIRERDGFLEILGPAAQAETRFRFVCRLARLRDAEQHAVRQAVRRPIPSASTTRRPGLTLSVWYPPARASNWSRSARDD